MRVVFYLDDMLIISDSHKEATSHCCRLRSLLDEFGFTLNVKKSELRRAKKFVYMGVQWDSEHMTVSLKENKRADIR